MLIKKPYVLISLILMEALGTRYYGLHCVDMKIEA